MASYNVGENRIKSVVMKNFTRDFRELARRKQIPNETIHYVPKFLAARKIASNPEKYGFTDLEYLKPLQYDTIVTNKPIDLKTFALALDVSLETIKTLNPAFRTNLAPTYGDNIFIKVPVGKAEMAKNALNIAQVKNQKVLAQIRQPTSILPTVKSARSGGGNKKSGLLYVVKRGDTLTQIARRHSVSVSQLVKTNRLASSGRVQRGQKLYIFSR
jgi:membrane-bound lytic murein transglycosylase D